MTAAGAATAGDDGHTPRLVVAAPASGAGKTTVATGLMAALADRGLAVAGGKVGPDYIDPSYHRLATGRASATLDVAMSGGDLVAPLARRHARGCDAMVVEGVMGLFDGVAPERAAQLLGGPEAGRDQVPGGDATTAGAAVPVDPAAEAAPADAASTAHVARLLDAPVVLVVDASAAATSVAATVHGFATFDPRLRLAGVIANGVGSPRHAELIAGALDRLGVALLGWLPRDGGVAAPGRHLGLVPAVERAPAARDAVAELARLVAASIDLDAVLAAAATAPAWPAPAWTPPFQRSRRARVGVAAGPAFSFAYPDDLALLEAAGAELAWFDPTVDAALPPGCDGLVLSGGFPEVYAAALSANAELRADIAARAAAGAPVRAECGGLAYLATSLDDQPMCGVLPVRARMTQSLTLGYRRAVAAADAGGWRAGQAVVGHEFHYSVAEAAVPGRVATNPAGRAAPALDHGPQTAGGTMPPGSAPGVTSGAEPGAAAAWRVDGRGPEGFALGGVHASYLHTHWAAHPEVADRFVAACAAGREAACA